jgi:hypothetical protein
MRELFMILKDWMWKKFLSTGKRKDQSLILKRQRILKKPVMPWNWNAIF